MYRDFLSLGMDAKELRIGNLVYAFKTFYPIDSTDFESNKISTYKPIPLTEDWFWKAGFLKESTLVVDVGWLFDKPDFGSFYKEQDYWLPKPYYFGDSFGPNFKLKYVHQLQNLYFALTGEELQIERYKV